MFKLIWFFIKLMAKVAIIVLFVNTVNAILLKRALTLQELLAFQDLPEKIQFLFEIGGEKLKEIL